MQKIFSLSAIAVLCCILSSCGYFTMSKNNENLKELRVGMSKDQVLGIMGDPEQNQIYTKPDLWWYYTDSQWSDSVVTRDECTPLVFKNDKLAGWGYDYYKANYSLVRWDKKGIQKAEESF